jgi:hypothetical protein
MVDLIKQVPQSKVLASPTFTGTVTFPDGSTWNSAALTFTTGGFQVQMPDGSIFTHFGWANGFMSAATLQNCGLNSCNYDGLTIGASNSSLGVAANKNITFNNTLTFDGTDGSTIFFGNGGTVLYGNQPITLSGDVTGVGSTTITTTVAKIAGTAVSGTTGSGNVVFSASPTFTGVATFANGTTALPSITGTVDSTTGLSFPASQAFTFSAGAAAIFDYNNRFANTLYFTVGSASMSFSTAGGANLQYGSQQIGVGNGVGFTTPYVFDANYSYFAPSTGNTITLAGWHSIINPSATIATLTIKMPASPVDGQIVEWVATQIVSAVTIEDNGGTAGNVVGSPTSLAVAGHYQAIYHSALTKWYM